MIEYVEIESDDKRLDLIKVQGRLRAKYGYDSPSYPTLRRWAEDGKLASAVRSGPGEKRTMYAPFEVERIFLQSSRGKKIQAEPSLVKSKSKRLSQRDVVRGGGPEYVAGEPQNFAELNSKMEMLIDMNAAVLAKMALIEEKLNAMATTLGRLDGLKNMLMLKYDAQVSSQAQLLELMRGKLKEAERGVDTDRVLMKLSGQVTNLLNKLEHGGSFPST